MGYALKKESTRTAGQCTQPIPVSARWHDGEELRWCVRHWASKIGVSVAQIHLREMSSKWASISTRGRLTLNTELLELPKQYGEYVVIHELVHLIAPNHGKVFKSFMDAYCPEWEEIEKHLHLDSTKK